MKIYAVLASILLGIWAQPSHAQVSPGGGCGSTQNPCSVTTTSSATSTPLTPADISPSSNLSLVTGGASQTLIAALACPNFITINNATTAAGQGGIAAAESAWVKRTGGTVTMTGGGTSTEIAAGVTQSFLASTVIMTWTAPTTGHKINAWCE